MTRKTHLEMSLELLWVAWGQFSARHALVPAGTCSQVCGCPSNVPSLLNFRLAIRCTCQFWNGSPFFSLQVSLQCLVSALTQEGENAHQFGLACSAALWRGKGHYKRNATACVGSTWQWTDHMGAATAQAPPKPKLLRLPGALRGHSPRWAVHFLRGAGLRL